MLLFNFLLPWPATSNFPRAVVLTILWPRPESFPEISGPRILVPIPVPCDNVIARAKNSSDRILVFLALHLSLTHISAPFLFLVAEWVVLQQYSPAISQSWIAVHTRPR